MSLLLEIKNLKGKELYNFLVKNRKELIAEKKALPKYAEPAISDVAIVYTKATGVTKAAGDAPNGENGVLRVKMVCNASNWCDSHLDVGIPGYVDKTIKERGAGIVHLRDHVHSLTAKVGDTVSVYTQNIALRDLGLDMDGTTQCMIMESDVKELYDPKVFSLYKSGGVTQHSIGLLYVKLSLCINDEDYKEEFAAWQKYYPDVINKDFVNKYGFFWAMEEIKVFENSGVLFGSNELTPTLDAKATAEEPEESTHQQPEKKSIAFGALIN